jgi:hypothetical protein
MRRNGPTSNPARTIGITGAAFGLAALLCLGSPAGFASASGSDTAPAPAETAPGETAPTETAPKPVPPVKPSPSASPTPTAAPKPAPNPTATPAPTAPPAPAELAPEGVDTQLGGFSLLVAGNDTFTAVAAHSARYPWSSVLSNDVAPSGQPVLLDSWNKPTHGTIVSDATSSFLYTPDPGFIGADTFTYSITDVYGNFSLTPGVVTINVIPNSIPVAVADSYSVPAGKPFVAKPGALLTNDTDEDADDLTVNPKVVLGPDNGTAILNANGDGGFTYTPAAGYTGFDSFFYRVSDGHGGTTSLAAVEITVVNDFVTVKPKVTGTAAVGSTLSITVGTWTPAPTTQKYQWFRDGDPIAGATAKSYIPTVDDLGYSLRAMVIGSKAGYPTEQVYSSGTAAIVAGSFTSTPNPTISGIAKVGSTLTAKTGTWAPVPAKVSYYWKAAGVLIQNADLAKSTYTLTAAEIGKKISVTVYMEKPGFNANHTDSAFTSTVLAKTFTATPSPTIAGITKVGRTLTAQTAAWTPVVTSTGYQWKRSGVAISGATASTYKLSSLDRGNTITVVVTGTRSGYTTVSKSSAATTVIAAGALTATPTPTIGGTAKVGSLLTAKAGTWAPLPVTLTYQWKRNGVAISGANASTYKPAAADAGAKLTVSVKGSKTGYTSVTRASAATPSVAK